MTVTETAGTPLDRLEAAWRQHVGSTEIDPRLRLRLGVGVRLPKGLHSSPDFDSLVFLSDLTGKRGDPSWDEPSRLQQVAVHFVLDRASDTTERELHEEIGEPHVKVDGLRLALLRGDGEQPELLNSLLGAHYEPAYRLKQRSDRMDRGVAKDRITTIADPDMRHWSKTLAATPNGLKTHIAMDGKSMTSVVTTAANSPDAEPLPEVLEQCKADRARPDRLIWPALEDAWMVLHRLQGLPGIRMQNRVQYTCVPYRSSHYYGLHITILVLHQSSRWIAWWFNSQRLASGCRGLSANSEEGVPMARLMRLFYKLTRRELEIVAVMNSYPHCNANMLSELLCVTRSCVYGHCSRIYAKLRVTNKLEMLLWCRENELVSGLEEFVPDCARRRAEELGIVSRSLQHRRWTWVAYGS